ncbi:MAG: hypothetical protein U9Q61_00980, partial [Thermodesulfobacteriota bacterium]|nr:hypothetical protein [Thermodesulfobacteriota bacterium]
MRKLLKFNLIIVLLLALMACGSGENVSPVVVVPALPPVAQYPDESQFTAIPTNGTMLRPDYLFSSIDPEFHTKVTRITDKDVFEAHGDLQGYIQYHPTHSYPKNQPWNSDGSYLRIQHTLIDGNTYQIIRNIGGSIYERKWSRISPEFLYGINHTAGQFNFVRQNVETLQVDTLTSFSDADYDEVLIGPWEGTISFDDKFVALTAWKDHNLTVIVYNILDDLIVSERIFAGLWHEDNLDWVSISPLGNYVLMNWLASPGDPVPDNRSAIDQYDINLNYIRELSAQGQHGDIGLDENNQEVYVQFEFGGERGVWSYRLNDGNRTRLLPDKYNGGHVSCKNYRRPGWCYLSTKQEGYREVFALKLDGSGIVNRFAQTRESDGVSSYGSPNPEGTRVLFRSDWGGAAELDSFA